MRFLKSLCLIVAMLTATSAMANNWKDNDVQFIVKKNGITYDIKNRTKGWDDVRITTPISNTGVNVRFWYKNKPGLHRYRAEFSTKSITSSVGPIKLWAKPSFMLNAGDGYDKPVVALYAGGYTPITSNVTAYFGASKWVKTEDFGHSYAYYRYGLTYKVDKNMSVSLGVLNNLDKNWGLNSKNVQLGFKYNL